MSQKPATAKDTLCGQLPILLLQISLENSIVPQCALNCNRFFGTPCILYYTLYSLKETLRDQCTPTQKVMLLLFIINPLIQENTNNVVKGTSNEAFCLFKIGFD